SRTLDHGRIDPLAKLFRLEPQPEISQALDRRSRRLQTIEGEIQLLAIGHRDQKITYGLRLITHLEQLAKRIDVAERLRHLLRFDIEKLAVQPESRKRFSGDCF